MFNKWHRWQWDIIVEIENPDLDPMFWAFHMMVKQRADWEIYFFTKSYETPCFYRGRPGWMSFRQWYGWVWGVRQREVIMNEALMRFELDKHHRGVISMLLPLIVHKFKFNAGHNERGDSKFYSDIDLCVTGNDVANFRDAIELLATKDPGPGFEVLTRKVRDMVPSLRKLLEAFQLDPTTGYQRLWLSEEFTFTEWELDLLSSFWT